MTEDADTSAASAASNHGNGGSQVWSGAPDRPANLALVLAVSVAVLAIPFAFVGIVAFALLPGPWWLGALLALAIAAVLVYRRLQNADDVVLQGFALVQAPRKYERLLNMVEGLTLAGGVVPPQVLILDEDSRNAMAIRRHDRNHLILTRGLVEALDVVSLEGAVAELLSRLRNGDAEAATIAAALFGRPILDGPLDSVLGPLARAGIDRLLNEDRDIAADNQAVSLTRYPPGLRQALSTLRDGEVRPEALTPGTVHLWLADPDEASGARSRTPLGLRMDILAEL